MAIRCGCWAEGDATVFGDVHECSKDPELRYTRRALPPLVPSWAFVVTEAIRATTELRQSDFTLSPPEPRYMEMLGEDETHD
jgi:hypothetical protein